MINQDPILPPEETVRRRLESEVRRGQMNQPFQPRGGYQMGPEGPGDEDPWAHLNGPEDPVEGEGQPEDQRGFFGKLRDSMARGAMSAVDETVGFVPALFGADVELFGADRMPEEADGFLFGAVEGLTQFGVGIAGVGKVMKPLQLGRKAFKGVRALGGSRRLSVMAGRVLPFEAAAVVTDFVAFEPYEEKLANMVADLDNETAAAIGEFLDVDDDDGQLEARAKGALEGALLGSALGVSIAGFSKLVRIAHQKRMVERGAISAEEAAQNSKRIAEEEVIDDDVVEIFHNPDTDEAVVALKNIDEMETSAEPYLRTQTHEVLEDPDYFDPEEDVFLWHATIGNQGVMDLGLKTGMEAPKEGLQGGDFSISATWKRQKAETIANYFRVQTKIANGLEGGTTPGEVLGHFNPGMGYYNPFAVLDESDEAFGDIESFLRNSFDPEHVEYILGDTEFEDWVLREGMGTPVEYEMADEMLQSMYDDAVDLSAEAVAERLDEVYNQHMAREIPFGYEVEGEMLQPEEWLSELAITLDVLQPKEFGSFSTAINGGRELVKKFSGQSLDDIQVLQVVGKKDVRPTVNVAENELMFTKADDVETVERVVVAGEREAATLNMLLKRRLQGLDGVSDDKIFQATRSIREAIESGKTPEQAHKELGLNLGLLVKTNTDFARASKTFAEGFQNEIREARQRVADGFADNTWEATIERGRLRMLEALGPDASLANIRTWAREAMGKDLKIDDVDEVIWAGWNIMQNLATDITKIAKLVETAGDATAERANLGSLLTEMTTTFADIQTRLAGRHSTMGRSFNFLKTRGLTKEQLDELKIARAEGGVEAAAEEADQIKLTRAEVYDLSRNFMLTNGDPEKINAVIRHMADLAKHNAKQKKGLQGKWDHINWFRTNMLLSGPVTHMTNALNNALVAFWLPVEHMWGGLRTGNKELMRFGADEMVGAFSHINDGLRGGWEAMRRGQNVLDPGHRIDEGLFESAPLKLGWIGKAVNFPGRALMASDEVFKQINYRAHVRAQSLRNARQMATQGGLSGKEASDFISSQVSKDLKASVVNKGSSEADAGLPVGLGKNPWAMQHARYGTFTNDLPDGSFGNRIRQIVHEHGWARFIMPFVRTPINLLKFGWERTPVINKFHHDHLMDLKSGDPGRMATAKAREELGGALWGSAAALMVSGRLTGNGPSDPELRNQWLDAGNQPYSIRLSDGKWISYRRIEPLSTVYGLLAEGAEVALEAEEGDALDTIAFGMVGAFSSFLSQKTFLTGLADFASVVSDGNYWEVESYIDALAGSFTPNFLNQVNNDPHYRETRHLLIDSWRKRTPGFSQELEPRRNIFGEKVMKPPVAYGTAFGGPLTGRLSPMVSMVPPEDAKMRQAFVDLGKALPYPTPRRMEGQIDLQDRQKYDNGTDQSPYDRMFEIVRNPGDGVPPLRKALENLVESPQWDNLGSGAGPFQGGGRYEAARGIVTRYYEMAYRKVRQEYPQLQEELIRLEGVRAQGMMNTGALEQDEAVLNR